MHLLICLLLFPSLLQAEELNLREAQEAATRTPRFEAALAMAEASREGIQLAGTLPEPRLGVSLQPRPVETRLGPQQGALQLQQPLPWPGTLQVQKERAHAEARGEFYRLQNEERELRLAAGKAWLALWQQEREIEHLSDLLDWSSRQRASLEAEYAAGIGRSGASLRARLGEEQARLRLAEGGDRLHGLRQALARAIGRSQGEDLVLPADLTLPGSLPDNAGVQDHPAVLQATSSVLRARSSEELSRLASRPDLSFGLSWLFIGEAEMPVQESGRDALALNLSIRLPLWQGANQARRALAAQERAGASAGLRDTELRLLERWRLAQDARISAERDEERLRIDLLPIAEALLESTEEEYRGGLARYDELASAAMDRTRLRLQRDASLVRLWKATLELEELARPARSETDGMTRSAQGETRRD